MHHIESLEHRQLLSAAHPAAKTPKPKPTIPNIAFEFTGTGTETKPIHATAQLSVNIATESVKALSPARSPTSPWTKPAIHRNRQQAGRRHYQNRRLPDRQSPVHLQRQILCRHPPNHRHLQVSRH